MTYIIKSIVLPYKDYSLSYIFYSSKYITTNINFSSKRVKLSIYLNLGYPITLKD